MRTMVAVILVIALWSANSSELVWAEHRWTLAAHLGNADLDGLTRNAGQFLGDIDDDNTSLGSSLAYEIKPYLGVRAMYERATGFGMVNRCPSGAVCPAVLITDRGDLDAWSLAALPRLRLNDRWSVYGIVGALFWDISTDGQLPGDSGTELTAGAGIGWRPTPRFEFGLEYQHADFDYNAWRLNFGLRF